MGTRLATTIDKSGPFFEKDPAKTFRQNIRALMDVVAEEGESDVKVQLRQGQSLRQPLRGIQPDRVADHVVGRTKNLRGRRWAVTAVVSVVNPGLPRKQAVSLMAAASELETRTHAFRRTTTRLRRMRAKAEAELLKGIA